jgi:hypothetical protein
MKLEDVPVLRELHREAGYDYEFPDLTTKEIEDVTVVVDENDQPLAAGVAKRTLELYLIMGRAGHPLVKIKRIRELHQEMTKKLKAKGFTEANAFLPPELADSYGRHLARFGWLKNNPSFAIRG